MKLQQLIVLLGVLLTCQTNYAQWTKGEGNGFYKLSAWSLESSRHYTSTGAAASNPTRGNFNLSIYGEHGLTDKIDVVGYIPFFTRVYQNEQTANNIEGEAVNALGDIDLGLRYRLLKNKQIALSAALKLGLPTGKSTAGSDGSFQTGDGEFNQLLTLNAGTSYKLFKIPGYSKIHIGFNNRTQGFSDEFIYGAEAGFKFFNKLWLTANLKSLNSLQNGSLAAQNTQGSLFANNIEYQSIGMGASYNITPKLGISINYATATSGKIIYASPTLSGGVFIKTD